TSALVFDAILNRPAVPLSQTRAALPAELGRIVSKALEKDKDLRYQVASEMRADLKRLKREIESGNPSAVRAMQGPAPPGGQLARGRLWAGLVIVTVLIAAAAVVWFTAQKSVMSSVAVLPFTNDMGTDSEYLADGITEDVINNLAQIQ